MFWKDDPEVEALRKTEAWKQFHAEAGKRGLYFDNIKHGQATAFTLQRTPMGGWQAIHLADGKGRASLAALEGAYRASGRTDAALDRLVDQMTGRAVEVDEFDGLFDGTAPADDFADIFD
jgi:hypothetical protein